MTERYEGSDWLRPSAYRPSPAEAGGADGGGPPVRRTRAETQAARQAAQQRTRQGARQGTRSARVSAPPAAPPAHESDTEPVPAVTIGRGPRSRGGDGSRGGRGGRGGGGGGGGGDDNGSGNDRGGASQADRDRNRRVALVLLVILLPFAAAVIWFILSISPQGSTTTKTAPPGPQSGEVNLFLRPGLTVSQIGDVVAALPGHTKAGFLAQANSGQIRSEYEPATAKSLEGLMYPDTYFVGTHESDASVVRRLVDHFDQIGDQIGLNSATTVSPYQTIIVASLIQQEAKLPSDEPLVAAVIYNRLKIHMPLQVDATLCYAKGGCPPVPTATDEKLNSPYNTYVITGLPPTPIASVTQESLQAAMQPANVPYLYYVIGDSTGKLAFSTTLAQQQHNIALAKQKGIL